MSTKSKRLNRQILSTALDLYGIQRETVTNLHGNESFVYSYVQNRKNYILKIIQQNHRSSEELIAEVNWLLYLHHHNVSVALPIQSKNGMFVEEINEDDHSRFFIISYEKAAGREVHIQDLTPALIQNWGETMGMMHRVTKSYKPSGRYVRKHWYENQHLTLFASAPPMIKQKFDVIKNKLLKLPRSVHDYGLIHSDLHHKNFLLDESTITVIDFDDAEYSWFINDIAKTIYNETYSFGIPPKERNKFAHYFLKHFFDGYERENTLDPEWMKYFQDFLELRHLVVFMRKYHSSGNRNQNQLEKIFQANYKSSLLNINEK